MREEEKEEKEEGEEVEEWVRESVRKTDKGGVYKVVDVFEVEGGGEGERGWARWQETMAERFVCVCVCVCVCVYLCVCVCVCVCVCRYVCM